MTDVTIYTHFSQPNWPVVNKLRAISKCLDVGLRHCSTLERLRESLEDTSAGRNLFFTDEGMIDLVQEYEKRVEADKLEIAMFITSPIGKVAQKVSNLSNVKYLIGAQPAESFGRDLSILIKKFVDGDILDLEKYLAYGSKISERAIRSPETKRDAIDAVINYVSRLGDPGYNHPFDEYARRIAELTEELLLNAIFDANPRLRKSNRSLPFKLAPEEEVVVSWGYDGEYFGISVRDPFGKFTSETILKYLSSQRQVEDIVSADSGGLGLKFIFDRAHQVVTNVTKGQVTEVIALVRLANRMLEFESQKKSFFFFGEDAPVKKPG